MATLITQLTTSPIRIDFSIGRAETRFGESLLIVGSHPTLGQWNPLHGVRLRTNESSYPKWKASVTVENLVDMNLEYKYVRDARSLGEDFIWETGENRTLVLPVGNDIGLSVKDHALNSLMRDLMHWNCQDQDFFQDIEDETEKYLTDEKQTEDEASNPAKSQTAAKKDERVALETMKLSVLHKKAAAVGATAEEIERAVDEANPKSALADLILSNSSAGQKETEDTATTAPSEVDLDVTSEVSENVVACSNFPKTMSLGSQMERLASYSALQLVEEPEKLLELRGQTEHLEDRPVRYGARHLGTPVVIVSSELNPWSKTGGLGMVASSYAFEFALRGHRTMAIVPMYGEYGNTTCIGAARIWLAGSEHEVLYYHQEQVYGPGKACDYIFVYHPSYRRAEGIYGPPGGEYGDNLFRFALLSLAAAEAPLVLNIGGSTYGDNVLFIANDWQTGLLPVYLAHKYKKSGIYQNARSIMVIHNIGYQGRYRIQANPLDSFLGLPQEAGADLQGEDMHFGFDCMNLLSAGIRKADRVLTVSPAYAMEIQSPEGGHGLHELLRWKAGAMRVAGILNGISDEWNPRTDKQIPRNYGIADFEEGKRACKAALQRELGLHEDPGAALIGFCGRLCYQKGITLILPNIPWMMEGHAGRIQLIIMGKGDPAYSRDVMEIEGRFRHRVCGYVGFDPCIEHRMMAGCDILLMPSQYEPCGLPQMYAQQYGTLPIVHETGGLKDSVRGLWDEGRDKDVATGFLFSGFNDHALREKLHRACEVFQHRRHIFRQMQDNAMRTNFSWPQAIDEYERHIDWTIEDPPFAG